MDILHPPDLVRRIVCRSYLARARDLPQSLAQEQGGSQAKRNRQRQMVGANREKRRLHHAHPSPLRRHAVQIARLGTYVSTPMHLLRHPAGHRLPLLRRFSTGLPGQPRLQPVSGRVDILRPRRRHDYRRLD